MLAKSFRKVHRLIKRPKCTINNNFLYNAWFWKDKNKETKKTQQNKKKVHKGMGALWRVISSFAKITKNQVTQLQI